MPACRAEGKGNMSYGGAEYAGIGVTTLRQEEAVASS